MSTDIVKHVTNLYRYSNSISHACGRIFFCDHLYWSRILREKNILVVSYAFSSLITTISRITDDFVNREKASCINVLINLTRGRGLSARRSFCIGIGNASKTTPIDSQNSFWATSGDGNGRPTFRFARKPIIAPVDLRNRREKYIVSIFYYGDAFIFVHIFDWK